MVEAKDPGKSSVWWMLSVESCVSGATPLIWRKRGSIVQISHASKVGIWATHHSIQFKLVKQCFWSFILVGWLACFTQNRWMQKGRLLQQISGSQGWKILWVCQHHSVREDVSRWKVSKKSFNIFAIPQAWNSTDPHHHSFTDLEMESNYCRNPRGYRSKGP